MPWIGFKPTIPVFERTKTVHALDHAATVTGKVISGKYECWQFASHAIETRIVITRREDTDFKERLAEKLVFQKFARKLHWKIFLLCYVSCFYVRVGCVSRTEEYRVWFKDLKEKSYFGIVRVHGRIMLSCISKVYVMRVWSGFDWFRLAPRDGVFGLRWLMLGLRVHKEF
jgi:hypothetical protein